MKKIRQEKTGHQRKLIGQTKGKSKKMLCIHAKNADNEDHSQGHKKWNGETANLDIELAGLLRDYLASVFVQEPNIEDKTEVRTEKDVGKMTELEVTRGIGIKDTAGSG